MVFAKLSTYLWKILGGLSKMVMSLEDHVPVSRKTCSLYVFEGFRSLQRPQRRLKTTLMFSWCYSVIGLVSDWTGTLPTFVSSMWSSELTHVLHTSNRRGIGVPSTTRCFMWVITRGVKTRRSWKVTLLATWSRIDQETFPTSIRMCKLTEVDGRGIGSPCTTKSEVCRRIWIIWIVYVILRHREVKGQLNVTDSQYEMLVLDQTSARGEAFESRHSLVALVFALCPMSVHIRLVKQSKYQNRFFNRTAATPWAKMPLRRVLWFFHRQSVNRVFKGARSPKIGSQLVDFAF